MAKTPNEVLKKTKKTDTKTDNDDKKAASPRGNALLAFIAKNKKGA